jgi:hypothetical protein
MLLKTDISIISIAFHLFHFLGMAVAFIGGKQIKT